MNIILFLVAVVCVIAMILNAMVATGKIEDLQNKCDILSDKYSRAKDTVILTQKEAETYKKEVEQLKTEITALTCEKQCCKDENAKAIEDLPKTEKIAKKSTTKKSTAKKTTKK